jgi:hypothetical protein
LVATTFAAEAVEALDDAVFCDLAAADLLAGILAAVALAAVALAAVALAAVALAAVALAAVALAAVALTAVALAAGALITAALRVGDFDADLAATVALEAREDGSLPDTALVTLGLETAGFAGLGRELAATDLDDVAALLAEAALVGDFAAAFFTV